MSHEAVPFTDILNKQVTPVISYISGNILPKGGTLLFGGESKIGKSFLALNMAKSLATGTNLYHSPIQCEESRVLMVEQEVGETGLQDRGGKSFAALSQRELEKVAKNFYCISKVADLDFKKHEGQKIMADLVSKYKPNVLILDPIGKMHTCDENSASEIGALFTFFDKLKKINPEDNMSVVFTHHFKKLDSKFVFGDQAKLDPHNFRGSNRWFSDPDTIVTVMVKRRNANYDPDFRWWEVRSKWALRQEEEPDDMLFSINEQNDGDVRYKYSINNEDHVVARTKLAKKTNCSAQNPVKAPEQGVMFRP